MHGANMKIETCRFNLRFYYIVALTEIYMIKWIYRIITQRDDIVQKEVNWFNHSFFFPISHGIIKKSPSAIFDRFVNLYVSPKMKPSQPVEMADWMVYVPGKQISIHWGQRIFTVHMPNKPNRYNSMSPRVGAYVIRTSDAEKNCEMYQDICVIFSYDWLPWTVNISSKIYQKPK